MRGISFILHGKYCIFCVFPFEKTLYIQSGALQEEIKNIKVSLQAMGEEFSIFENQLLKDLGQLECDIKIRKMHKFKRDEEDYARNEVYVWEKKFKPRHFRQRTALKKSIFFRHEQQQRSRGDT